MNISFLQGCIVEASMDSCVLLAGKVGYELLISEATFQKLPTQPSTEVSLYVHTLWREQQGPQLFAFMTRGEKQLFIELLALHGVGPKTALQIAGRLSPQQLADAVRQDNPLSLCAVPGIGKKTAEKILSELKPRVKRLMIESTEAQPQLPLLGDAIRALMHLGYSQTAAERAVRAAAQTECEDLSGLISSALQNV